MPWALLIYSKTAIVTKGAVAVYFCPKERFHLDALDDQGKIVVSKEPML